MKVCLTYPQMSIATHVATMRHGNNQKHRRAHRHGLKKFTWDMEVDGCAAEIILAAYLNLYWDGGKLNEYDERDVGGCVDARQTEWPDGRLRVHPDDPDGVPFVLVTGHDRTFDIVGWLFGHEAKRNEWWCDPVPGRFAFFVPQINLHDMQALRAWVWDFMKVGCEEAAA